MSEILWQSIIEKLDQLDKSVQAMTAKIDQAPDHKKDFEELHELLAITKMEIKKIPEHISIPVNEITGLKGEAIKLRAQLKEPLIEKVKHIHYLSKPLLACILLVMIIVGQSVWIGKLYDGRNENVPENQMQSLYLNDYLNQAKPKPHDHKIAPKTLKHLSKLNGNIKDSLK